MLLKNKYIYVTSNRNAPDTFATDKPITYYQICTFADQKTGRYHMRKITYGDDNCATGVTYYYLTPDQRELFYTYKKAYEYKDYANYALCDVEFPDGALLDQARSELFSTPDGTTFADNLSKVVNRNYQEK